MKIPKTKQEAVNQLNRQLERIIKPKDRRAHVGNKRQIAKLEKIITEFDK